MIGDQTSINSVKGRDQTDGSEFVVFQICEGFARVKNFVLVLHLLDCV